jgi:hypothetical protein
MTHDEAIQMIREALDDLNDWVISIKDESETSEAPRWEPSLYDDSFKRYQLAIAALDSLAVTPSEDAEALAALLWRSAWRASQKPWESEAAALITARDEAIRRECADRAVAYAISEHWKDDEYDRDNYDIDLGYLRAAIMGDKS